MLNIVDGVVFDDVLLVPKYSEISSRANVNIGIVLSKGIKLSHPIIPANMKTITGSKMAKRIADAGGMAILHRFMPLEEQLDTIKGFAYMAAKYENTADYMKHVGVSVGVKEQDYENVKTFYDAGVRIFCIDIAHGDSKLCVDMTKFISTNYPEVFLIAGNVATAEGAKRLWMAGADCVKCGVGSGAICTTRIQAGNGVPQLTVLSDIADEKMRLTTESFIKHTWDVNNDTWVKKGDAIPPQIKKPIFIIADGGIRNSGDIVKSLCFADIVMAGNLFAGTDETPSETLSIDGNIFKRYDGSSTHKTNHIEGVVSLVPTKGPVSNIIDNLCQGLRSGLSYQGVDNLTNLKREPKFVRITNAGIKESGPHDVIVIK